MLLLLTEMVLLSRSVDFMSFFMNNTIVDGNDIAFSLSWFTIKIVLKQYSFPSAMQLLWFNWKVLFFLFKPSLLNWPIQLTLVFSLKKRGWFRWAFYCLFMKKLGWVGGAFQEIRELHFVAYHITHFMPFMNSVSGFSLHFFHEHFTLYFSQKTT